MSMKISYWHDVDVVDVIRLRDQVAVACVKNTIGVLKQLCRRQSAEIQISYLPCVRFTKKSLQYLIKPVLSKVEHPMAALLLF